jgi:hypothetical protein
MTLCMAGCFGLVQVLQSKPEHLVDTFMLLMPASSQNMNEFVRVCDMKVGQGGSGERQPVRLPTSTQRSLTHAVLPACCLSQGLGRMQQQQLISMYQVGGGVPRGAARAGGCSCLFLCLKAPHPNATLSALDNVVCCTHIFTRGCSGQVVWGV